MDIAGNQLAALPIAVHLSSLPCSPLVVISCTQPQLSPHFTTLLLYSCEGRPIVNPEHLQPFSILTAETGVSIGAGTISGCTAL